MRHQKNKKELSFHVSPSPSKNATCSLFSRGVSVSAFVSPFRESLLLSCLFCWKLNVLTQNKSLRRLSCKERAVYHCGSLIARLYGKTMAPDIKAATNGDGSPTPDGHPPVDQASGHKCPFASSAAPRTNGLKRYGSQAFSLCGLCINQPVAFVQRFGV